MAKAYMAQKFPLVILLLLKIFWFVTMIRDKYFITELLYYSIIEDFPGFVQYVRDYFNPLNRTSVRSILYCNSISLSTLLIFSLTLSDCMKGVFRMYLFLCCCSTQLSSINTDPNFSPNKTHATDKSRKKKTKWNILLRWKITHKYFLHWKIYFA